MRPKNIFLKSLILSLLAHIIALCAIYFLTKDLSTSTQNQAQKVKLSFKRGGDSAVKNSPHKHNSSIPKSLPTNESAEEMPFFMQSIATKPADSAKDSAKDSATKPADSTKDLAKDSTKNLAQNLAVDSVKTPTKPLADSTKDSTNDSANNPADSTPNALNLASLQVQNLNSSKHSEQKRKEMANYIASKAIPSDIKAEIFDLYGDELGDYGLAEIDFIINNLRDIGRITQYHINRRGYPQNALIMHKQGKNVVEFYLHPNGDISELRVAKSSDSAILDNDMLTNIKVAFREYPRPTTKVKIRIYMTYRLY